jgi:hypothetical protein
MDKNKTDKKELLKLITEILTDEKTTVSDFIGILEKTLDKVKNNGNEEKKKLSEEEAEELLRAAGTVVKTEAPALLIAGCEDGKGSLEEMVVFAKGAKKDLIPLLGVGVYRVLKETGFKAAEFCKALEKLEKI